jgi:hypothetical protein
MLLSNITINQIPIAEQTSTTVSQLDTGLIDS